MGLHERVPTCQLTARPTLSSYSRSRPGMVLTCGSRSTKNSSVSMNAIHLCRPRCRRMQVSYAHSWKKPSGW